MKTFSIAFLLLTLSACSTTKYDYDSHPEKYGTPVCFKIDKSYQLYTRKVFRLFDSTYLLSTKPDSSYFFKGKKNKTDCKLVECEFLLISMDSAKAIVLNNIPTVFESFIPEDPALNRGFDANNIKQAKDSIDIGYVRQFRFGTVLPDSTISFSDTENNNLVWDIKYSSNSIELISVAKNGGDPISIENAFQIPIIFEKSNDFELCFGNRNTPTGEPKFSLTTDSTIYVTPDRVYVNLKIPVFSDPNQKTILFKQKRVYALPGSVRKQLALMKI